jgi:hypothetical protein
MEEGGLTVSVVKNCRYRPLHDDPPVLADFRKPPLHKSLTLPKAQIGQDQKVSDDSFPEATQGRVISIAPRS